MEERTITLTREELDLLIHFATIGQSHIIVRNAYGDREVCRELDPVLRKVWNQVP